MRKMNHELHSGDDALQTSKKTRAVIPDEVKHTFERTKKTRAFIPGRGSPYFVTSHGLHILEHGKKMTSAKLWKMDQAVHGKRVTIKTATTMEPARRAGEKATSTKDMKM